MPGELHVEILTERLRLALPAPSDAPVVLHYHRENCRHLERWSPPAPDDFYTETHWEQRLAESIRDYEEDRAMRLVIYPRDDPSTVIGTCNYTDFVRGGFQACHLGYGLAEARQGAGLMTEAIRESLKHVFGVLRLHRVMANYMPVNSQSGRVLRRLGFVPQGFARDYLFINGAWQDHILTALTNPDAAPPTSELPAR